MNLFLSAPPKLEKTASAQPLVGRPENWEGEILAALYKQAPYVGQYRVDFSISQENREAGFLLGYFIISPQVATQATAQSTSQAPGQQSTEQVNQDVVGGEAVGVRIPAIVTRTSASAVLKSFDIMLDGGGQAQPLTEARLNAIMADSGQYEATKAPVGVEGMTPNEPPQMQGNGQTVLLDKQASYPLLSKIASRMTDTEVEAFKEKLADPEVLYAASSNPAFREAVATIVCGQTKVASVIDAKHALEPSVLLIKRASKGYSVLSASSTAYEPVREFVPYERSGVLPAEVQQAVAEEGAVLFSDLDDGRRDHDTAGAIHSVHTSNTKTAGRHYVSCDSGIESCRLIPTMYGAHGGVTGQVLLLKQAAAGGAHAHAKAHSAPVIHLQHVEKTASTDGWMPWTGAGAVTFVSDDLSAATEPLSGMMIRNRNGNHSLLTYDGVTVMKVASIVRPFRSESTLCVPLEWHAVAVGDELSLVDGEVRKVAALAASTENDLAVSGFGSSFNFAGASVSDLRVEQREGLDTDHSLLLLGAVGFPLNEGMSILKEAARMGRKVCSSKRKLQSMGSARERAVEKVASRRTKVTSLNLIKEAATLTAPQSIDAVLALNFVTPENLEMFLNKRPDLEASLRTLCDLLLQCRLGLEDVKESAVERAVKGLTDTLLGLDAAELRMQAP